LLGSEAGPPALLHFIAKLPHGIFSDDATFAGSE
jgi:hypothetical protein